MSIRQMIEERAHALAGHDGVAATIMHLHAAASVLGAEIRRELDALVSEFRPAGAAVASEAAAAEALIEPAQICAGEDGHAGDLSAEALAKAEAAIEPATAS